MINAQKTKRIKIITGHYGSGKTEFAINFAVKLADSGKKVALADMDVVNPYFRSRECATLFHEKNIELLGFSVTGDAMDLPAVSGNVMKGFLDDSYEYIVDLGGNSVGALAFSSFRKLIDPTLCDVFFVLNANRPETSDLTSTLVHLNNIEGTLNMKVTGIVNNTHLIWETTSQDLEKGDKLAKELSHETGIPIKYLSCKKDILDTIPNDLLGERFSLEILNRKSWM